MLLSTILFIAVFANLVFSQFVAGSYGLWAMGYVQPVLRRPRHCQLGMMTELLVLISAIALSFGLVE